MKYCQNCGEQNYDESAVCYNCGQPLPNTPRPASDEFPTQPLHVQPPHHTQVRPAQPAYPNQQAPYDPNNPQGYPPGYQQPGYQQQHPGYTQPGYQQQPGYPYPGYPQQPYQPPYQPPQEPSALKRYWPVLALGGVVAVLCLCAVAFLFIGDAASRGVAGLRSSFATQVAGVIPGGEETPEPTAPAVLDPVFEPTPWPSFTPEPLPTAAPVEPTQEPTLAPQPEPTDSELAEKLLSPECKTALDELGRMGGEVSSEPFRLLDSGWREQFNAAQAAVRTHCGSIDSASPVPERLRAVQENLAQANAAFDEANRLWQEAIDTRDPAKVLDAAGQFQQATRYLNQAITELRSVVP